jgi:hypothetical protein
MKARNCGPRHGVGLCAPDFGPNDLVEQMPVEYRRPGFALRFNVLSHETVGQFGNS